MEWHTFSVVNKKTPYISHNESQVDLGGAEAVIEDIHQIPELLPEDVERILSPSDQYLQVAKEDKEDNQTQPPEHANEINFTYNPKKLILSAENEKIDTQSHLKQGVLNMNIKKILEEENMRSVHKNHSYANQGTSVHNYTSYPSSSSRVLKRPWEEDPHLYVAPHQSSHTAKLVWTEVERPEQPLCNICTKPALMSSSYGGQACSSCRSFFRRSVIKGVVYTCAHAQMCKISPDTRKNCQYCRYKLCLMSGMKTTWVLSLEEKQRRFKKLKMLKKEIIPSVLDIPFSSLEENILQSFTYKSDVPWLENLFVLDKDAGVSLIEYVYGNTKFSRRAWGVLENSMRFDFERHILPTLEELEDFSPHDLGQIKNSHNSGIANFFRLAYWIDIGSSTQTITCLVPAKV